MLEQLDLTKSMSKDEYKERMDILEPELAKLQRDCLAEQIPVMIVFEGFGAAGKGEQISRLIHALDPRGFYVESIGPETEEERMHPFLWRFWMKIPADTQIAIFDRSWYRKVVEERMDTGSNTPRLLTYYNAINSFERQLTDSGMIILKFFLCIDKKEQKKRFEKLESSPSSAWRVSESDWEHNKRYDEYKQMYDEMLEQTDTACAPWTIIESTNRRFATVKIYTAVINALNFALNRKKQTANSPVQTIAANESQFSDEVLRTSSLNKVDLSLSLTKEEYSEKLKYYQDRIEELHGEIYKARIPVILGFEGWDAAGKGGAIKRLTEKMDPRGYLVHPSASPTNIEKVHHYLWRFWTHIPKDGHITIFDRTWYGRVMVERIEGFCTTEEWQRAYQEINEMEKQFVDHGAIVIKFWLQIDKDEQERRFNDRMNDPNKQYKITDEDWRNREKWDEYEKAVDEMLVRTSTTAAPWVIVEGNSKYYARIKVLQTVVEAMEKRLKELK